MSRLDNRAYYDDFAGWYERERHLPYHRMLDDLEVELVERYARRQGRARGRLRHRPDPRSRRAVRARARAASICRAACSRRRAARGLDVAQASATELPIATASVDVAYSFKVLAHIPDIAGAMREMARVVRPGGWVLAEFYNARSLRRLVKALKPPTAVSRHHARRARLHPLRRRRARSAATCRPSSTWVTTRGIRVITPVAKRARACRCSARAVRWAEHRLADLPGARDVGGFLVACCKRS